MLILKALLYFLALVFIGGTVFGCVCTLAAWWVTERVRGSRSVGPAVPWGATIPRQRADPPVAKPWQSLAGIAPDLMGDKPAEVAIKERWAHVPDLSRVAPVRLECGCIHDGVRSYVCAIHARAWRLH